MNIEFFHSILCGHCFIMSHRMRTIVEKYPEIKITHRAFPLRWDDENEESDFKEKWEIANRIDDHHRFNIEGMKKATFPMPTSRLPMIAIQAATLAGGNEWDLFDAFQTALYSDNKNISNEDVIADIVMGTGVNFEEFLFHYQNPQTEAMIKEDFIRAEEYGLEIVPALIVEGKHAIVGTKRSDLAIKLLLEAAQTEGITLVER